MPAIIEADRQLGLAKYQAHAFSAVKAVPCEISCSQAPACSYKIQEPVQFNSDPKLFQPLGNPAILLLLGSHQLLPMQRHWVAATASPVSFVHESLSLDSIWDISSITPADDATLLWSSLSAEILIVDFFGQNQIDE